MPMAGGEVPTIFVVTPCFNAADTIDRTIASVASQAGNFNIRYHVQDGGSTDGTLDQLVCWRDRLLRKSYPRFCQEIDFTFASEVDEGMYDALLKGFCKFPFYDSAFLTWINADDILLSGALAFAAEVGSQFQPDEVAWIGGASCVLRGDRPIAHYDRFIPTEVIRQGLCDDVHWDFVQQEGTFFRGELWNAVEPSSFFRCTKLAGDWNLWRHFAQRATLVQAPQALGAFRIRSGQLSARHRDLYNAEIDSVVPRGQRAAALRDLGAQGSVERCRFVSSLPDGRMSVIEERKTWQLRERYKHVFREEPPGKPASEASRLFLTGCPKVTNAIASPSPTSRQRQHFVDDKHKLISYDQGWQFPAITEQHAFERIREWIVEQEAVTFVAYPWATLIDKLQVEAVDAKAHVASFRKFCARIPTTGIKVTVCQQILLKRFHYLFKEAKITHVFWSHASVGDVDNDDLQGLELIPFPLYPVQIPSALKGATIDQDYAERRYLFSFVGARANRYYPKQTRNWIIDELAHVPKGLIAGRDQWFYQKIVYDHQIRGTAAQVPPDKLLKQNEATAFRETLLQSTFSLCPAGTGPNSIRLWESIGAGAIPVILADTWAPPGNRALWEEAAVFCPETPEDVKALPDRLAAIAADPAHLAAKRHAMRQLWMLYGPENFVHDIQKFVLQKATENAAQTPAIVVPDRVRQLARAVLTTDPTPRAASLALVSAEATDRLLTAAKDTSLWADDPEIARACGRALEAIGADHALARNLARTRARARSRGAGPAKFGRRPSVFLFGRHAHRTPLAYAPYRTLAAPLLDLVERPEDADVLVSGFSIDLADNIEAVRAYQARNPSLRLVVLSEEPLWDTMWSGGYAEQVAMRTIDGAALTYRVINHVTSDVYRFARIPYFVTTSDDYIARYMHLFERNRSLSPREVLDVWRHASVRMAFFVEKRDDPKYDVVDRACDIFGLSRFRTRLAETAPAEGLLRIGNGWDAPRPRQALPDWHLDKLATLDKRCSIVSGLENTHQRDYISEKIFDAFAVQALPIYFASPRHRIHEIIPEGSFVNVYGLAPEEAQAKIAALLPDLALAERYVEAQNRLWELFRDVDALVAERLRLTEAVAAALTSVLEGSTSETEMLLSAAK